jgi:hypothetical protein
MSDRSPRPVPWRRAGRAPRRRRAFPPRPIFAAAGVNLRICLAMIRLLIGLSSGLAGRCVRRGPPCRNSYRCLGIGRFSLLARLCRVVRPGRSLSYLNIRVILPALLPCHCGPSRGGDLGGGPGIGVHANLPQRQRLPDISHPTRKNRPWPRTRWWSTPGKRLQISSP